MFKQLSSMEAKKLMESKGIMVADVRDEVSFKKGHIDKAVHLTVTKLQEFCNKTNKAKPILVYCYHGISSQAVAQHLVEQGFSEVYSLIGGYEAWVEQLNESK